MIFGFNTDVKFEQTVYHVQSEARESDLLLQTQVFDKGRCIGKRATSYAQKIIQPGYTIEEMHESLKAQHKLVVDAVREGRMHNVIGMEIEIQDVDGAGLSVKWLNPELELAEQATMRFAVTDSGEAVEGATVVTRMEITADGEVGGEAVTAPDGTAEMSLQFSNADAREAAVLVQATKGEKSVTRKFRVKRVL